MDITLMNDNDKTNLNTFINTNINIFEIPNTNKNKNVIYKLKNNEIFNLTDFFLEKDKEKILKEKNFFCTNCNILLNETFKSECDHIFCKECKDKIIECPIDKSETLIFNKENLIKSKIQNLNLKKCPIGQNCNFTLKLFHLEKHNDYCFYKKIQCEKNCGKILFKKDIEFHMKNNCHKSIGSKRDLNVDNLNNENINLLYNNNNFCVICNNLIKENTINEHINLNIYNHFEILFKENENIKKENKDVLNLLNKNQDNYKKLEDKLNKLLKENEYFKNEIYLKNNKNNNNNNINKSDSDSDSDIIKKINENISKSKFINEKKFNEIDIEKDNNNNNKDILYINYAEPSSDSYGFSDINEINNDKNKNKNNTFSISDSDSDSINNNNNNNNKSNINSNSNSNTETFLEKKEENKILIKRKLNGMLETIEYNINTRELNLNDIDLFSFSENLRNLKMGLELNSNFKINSNININTIKILNIQGNELGLNSENMKSIVEILKNNKTIEILNLENNRLGYNTKNMKHLSILLKNNKTIKEINLSVNYIGKEIDNMNYLKIGIIDNKYINKLDLRKNKLGIFSKNLKNLFEGIKGNKSIEILNLGKNKIGKSVQNMRNLLNGLKDNNYIKELDISNNQIGRHSSNIMELGNFIKENKSIKILNLEKNDIGRDIIIFSKFVDFIKLNKNLEILDLRNNPVNKSIEKKDLLEEIKNKTRIKELLH
jgi:hypothetical protein